MARKFAPPPKIWGTSAHGDPLGEIKRRCQGRKIDPRDVFREYVNILNEVWPKDGIVVLESDGQVQARSRRKPPGSREERETIFLDRIAVAITRVSDRQLEA